MNTNIVFKKATKIQTPMARYCSRPELKRLQQQRRVLNGLKPKQAKAIF